MAPALKRTEPTLEQWSMLYETADALKKMKPWEYLEDLDLITIQLPELENAVYCTAMGGGDVCQGINLYPDTRAVAGMFRMVDQDEDIPSCLALLNQRALTCYFGDWDELEKEDREPMKQLGISFRGKKQWVYFRSYRPGHLPWFIDQEEAGLLIKGLENMVMACLALQDGVKVDFGDGQTLLRFYLPEEQRYYNISSALPPFECGVEAVNVRDELLKQRIKNKKKDNLRLELDAVFFPFPYDEKRAGNGGPPPLVQLVLLVDRTSGLIIDQSMARGDEAGYDLMLEMLTEYLKEHDRPRALYLRGEEAADALGRFCREVNVAVYYGKGMPAVNRSLESVLKYMHGELEL